MQLGVTQTMIRLRLLVAATFISFCLSCAVMLLSVSCNQPTLSDESAFEDSPASSQSSNSQVSSGENTGGKKINGEVGFYSTLKIGMTKDDSFKHLPKGIAKSDFDGPLSREGGDIEVWEGVFPASSLPLLGEAGLPKGTVALFVLDFVGNKLLSMKVGLRPESVNPDAAKAIHKVLNAKYIAVNGSKSSNGISGPEATSTLPLVVQGNDDCELRASIKDDATPSWKGWLFVEFNSNEFKKHSLGPENAPLKTTSDDYADFTARSEEIAGFESLKFGMTEQETMSNLPWGLTSKDLSQLGSGRTGRMQFVYGDSIPCAKWSILATTKKDGDAMMRFALGFTDKGLEYITIIFPSSAAGSDAIDALKKYFEQHYGRGMVHDVDSERRLETWGISRPDSIASIWKEMDAPEGRLGITIGTKSGSDLYASEFNVS